MRLFTAIELNDSIKKELSVLQGMIKMASSKGNYTATDNFHLTLHFIGEVSEEQAEVIKVAIKKVAEKTKSFELILTNLEHFQKKNKHIIWVGVKGHTRTLYKLNQSIREELKTFNLSNDDIEYTPHITIGRQITLEGSFVELKEQIEVSEMPIKVKSISLMESKREDGKLVYKPIYNNTLQ